MTIETLQTVVRVAGFLVLVAGALAGLGGLLWTLFSKDQSPDERNGVHTFCHGCGGFTETESVFGQCVSCGHKKHST